VIASFSKLCAGPPNNPPHVKISTACLEFQASGFSFDSPKLEGVLKLDSCIVRLFHKVLKFVESEVIVAK
jgi:hypothetical protein